jgi:hypothetical protein
VLDRGVQAGAQTAAFGDATLSDQKKNASHALDRGAQAGA